MIRDSIPGTRSCFVTGVLPSSRSFKWCRDQDFCLHPSVYDVISHSLLVIRPLSHGSLSTTSNCFKMRRRGTATTCSQSFPCVNSHRENIFNDDKLPQVCSRKKVIKSQLNFQGLFEVLLHWPLTWPKAFSTVISLLLVGFHDSNSRLTTSHL